MSYALATTQPGRFPRLLGLALIVGCAASCAGSEDGQGSDSTQPADTASAVDATDTGQLADSAQQTEAIDSTQTTGVEDVLDAESPDMVDGGDAADIGQGECGAGSHRCGDLCVDDHDVASCGDRCAPCEVPAGAVGATCDGTACGVVCPPTWVACRGDTTCCAWRVDHFVGLSEPYYPGLGPDGAPQVVARAAVFPQEPRFARYDGATWTIEPLESEQDPFRSFFTAAELEHQPVVVYTSAKGETERLVIARRRVEGTWAYSAVAETVRNTLLRKNTLVVDANGTAHVAYDHCAAATGACGGRALRYRTVSAAGAWGEPVVLAADLGANGRPSAIAVSAAGSVCVAAEAGETPDAMEGRFGCVHDGAAELAPFGAPAAHVVGPMFFDAAGDVHVILWAADALVDRRRGPDGDWQETPIGGAAGLRGVDGVADGAGGFVAFAWSAGSEHVIAEYGPDGWTQRVLETPEGVDLLAAAIARDADGNPYVVGTDRHGAGTNTPATVFMRYAP